MSKITSQHELDIMNISFAKVVAERDDKAMTPLSFVFIEDMRFKHIEVRDETWRLWSARKTLYESELVRLGDIPDLRPRDDETRDEWARRIKNDPRIIASQESLDKIANEMNAYIFDHAWAIYFEIGKPE